MGLFDRLVDAGNRIRYGASDSEMVPMESLGTAPGLSPEIRANLTSSDPNLREAARHASKRATSAHFSTKKWGPVPALLGNILRETAQGAGTYIGSGGQQFFAKPNDPDEEAGMDLGALQNVLSVVNATEAEKEKAKTAQQAGGLSLLRGLFGR